MLRSRRLSSDAWMVVVVVMDGGRQRGLGVWRGAAVHEYIWRAAQKNRGQKNSRPVIAA